MSCLITFFLNFPKAVVLNGADYIGSKSIREQFTGSHIAHEVSRCQLVVTLYHNKSSYVKYLLGVLNTNFVVQILLAAFIAGNWTGLCWDVKRKQITAYAPGHPFDRVVGAGDWSVHSQAIDVLHQAMQNCINEFFDGWTVNWDNWTKVLLQCCPPERSTKFEPW